MWIKQIIEMGYTDLYRSFSTASDGSVLMLDICALMIITWSRGPLNAKVCHRDKGTLQTRSKSRGVYIEMTMAIVATETRKISGNASAWYICANFISSRDVVRTEAYESRTGEFSFRRKRDSKERDKTPSYVFLYAINFI